MGLVQSRACNAFGGIACRMDGPGILSCVVGVEIQSHQIFPARRRMKAEGYSEWILSALSAFFFTK